MIGLVSINVLLIMMVEPNFVMVYKTHKDEHNKKSNKIPYFQWIINNDTIHGNPMCCYCWDTTVTILSFKKFNLSN